MNDNAEPRSPCIGVCRLQSLDNGEEICSGCFRSIDEIINWAGMSRTEKLNVLKQLEARKNLL